MRLVLKTVSENSFPNKSTWCGDNFLFFKNEKLFFYTVTKQALKIQFKIFVENTSHEEFDLISEIFLEQTTSSKVTQIFFISK